MARRRGPRDARMGVGGMAGELGYGERGTVESTAMAPAQQGGAVTGPMGPPQGGPMLGAAVEPFAPTGMPDQPITAGLEPDAMMSPDPSDVLRAMYRKFPYPDLRRLLERSQMTDWDGMAQQAGNMNTMGGFMGMAESPDGDSWMRDEGIRGQVADQTMDRIRDERTGGRFAEPGANMNTLGGFASMADSPDGDSWMREEGMRGRVADQTMDRIREERTGGRFDSGVEGVGVLDQIVDGENAVILFGEEETELVVNVGLLPEEVQEGDVLALEFFPNEELTDARRADPSAMPEATEADNAAVLDRIVDGQFATLLVGPTETEIVVDISLLPEGAAEGDWFQIGFVVDEQATTNRRNAAERGLGNVRTGGRF